MTETQIADGIAEQLKKLEDPNLSRAEIDAIERKVNYLQALQQPAH